MPIDTPPSDDSIPTLTEVVQVPGRGLDIPQAEARADLESLQHSIGAAVTSEVVRQLEQIVDIRFRSELQRALQDAVDDACDTLQRQLDRDLRSMVERAVAQAVERLRGPL